MNCPKQQELLDFISGEAPALQEHVASCARCTLVARQLRKLREILRVANPSTGPHPETAALAAYYSGQRTGALESHLAKCDTCLSALAALADPADIEAPESLQREAGALMRPRRAAAPARPIWTWVAVAAAAIVLIVAAVMLVNPKKPAPIVRQTEKKEPVPPPKPEPEPPKPKPPEPKPPEPRPEPPKPEPEPPQPRPPEPKPEPKPEPERPRTVVNAPLPKINPGTAVAAADGLSVPALARTMLDIEDVGQVYLDQGSVIAFEMAGDKLVVRLKAGAAYFVVHKPIDVVTPCATVSVLGTKFLVDMEPKKTALVVVEGRVRFESPKGKVEVKANFASEAKEGGSPTAPHKADLLLVDWVNRMGKEPTVQWFAGDPKLQMSLGVPHGGWDVAAEDLAKALAPALNAGYVEARGYLNKPGKLWVNVDRPTEGLVDDAGNVGGAKETDRAKQIFEDFRSSAWAAAGVKSAPRLYAGFRCHYEGTRDIQIVTQGMSPALAQEAKKAWVQWTAKLEPIDLKFDVTDDIKFTDRSGILQPSVARHSMNIYIPNTLNAGPYADAFKKLIELIYKKCP